MEESNASKGVVWTTLAYLISCWKFAIQSSIGHNAPQQVRFSDDWPSVVQSQIYSPKANTCSNMCTLNRLAATNLPCLAGCLAGCPSRHLSATGYILWYQRRKWFRTLKIHGKNDLNFTFFTFISFRRVSKCQDIRQWASKRISTINALSIAY